MNGIDYIGMAAVLSAVLLGLPLVHRLSLRYDAGPELARKLVHISLGLGCLSFPWLFSHPLPVWGLAAMVFACLSCVRFLPSLRAKLGASLHGVERLSYGELLFAPAVATVFHAAQGQWIYYIVPLLILTLADAAGALAGTSWGRLRYGCGDGFKTVEGSFAFTIVAFLCVFLPLWGSGITLGHAIGVAFILAVLAMMAEGISDRGFDNLVLPLSTLFLLQRLLPISAEAIFVRVLALGILLPLVILTSRWSSLKGAALLAAALLGYGCAILADWRFVLPLLAIFFHHLVVTNRFSLKAEFHHGFTTILSLAIACLPWVVLAGLEWISMATGLLGVSIAAATHDAMLEQAICWWRGVRRFQWWRYLGKGWLIAGVPGLVWLPAYTEKLAIFILISMGLGILALRLLIVWEPLAQRDPKKWWLLKGGLAFATSTVALYLHDW